MIGGSRRYGDGEGEREREREREKERETEIKKAMTQWAKAGKSSYPLKTQLIRIFNICRQ